MRLATAAAVIFLLIGSGAGGVSGARFAKFKFQPDRKYKITISQTGEMTTSAPATGAQADDKIGPYRKLEQKLRIIIDLKTYTLSDERNIPLKVRFHDMDMTVTSGGQTVPMSMPRTNLEEREYDGALNDTGDIEIVSDMSGLAPYQARGVNLMDLLYLIPDLPERDVKPGDVFEDFNQNAGLAGQAEGNSAKIKYKVAGIDGDNITLATHMTSKITEKIDGGQRLSSAGSDGTIVYSLRDQICKSIKVDITVNTITTFDKRAVAEDDNQKAGKVPSVLVNKMHLDIKVAPAK